MAKDFLGIGWKYPVATDRDGRIAVSQYEEDIKEAIRIILLTGRGERLMRPDFGCGIDQYVFSAISMTNIRLMENEVRESLTLWEPRIDVLAVRADTSDAADGKLKFEVDYKVRSTNTRFNVVFPFYLSEGQ